MEDIPEPFVLIFQVFKNLIGITWSHIDRDWSSLLLFDSKLLGETLNLRNLQIVSIVANQAFWLILQNSMVTTVVSLLLELIHDLIFLKMNVYIVPLWRNLWGVKCWFVIFHELEHFIRLESIVQLGLNCFILSRNTWCRRSLPVWCLMLLFSIGRYLNWRSPNWQNTFPFWEHHFVSL